MAIQQLQVYFQDSTNSSNFAKVLLIHTLQLVLSLYICSLMGGFLPFDHKYFQAVCGCRFLVNWLKDWPTAQPPLPRPHHSFARCLLMHTLKHMSILCMSLLIGHVLPFDQKTFRESCIARVLIDWLKDWPSTPRHPSSTRLQGNGFVRATMHFPEGDIVIMEARFSYNLPAAPNRLR